ncbi:MAG TPA: hypothetical protein VNA25_17920 [Phycisphaerae bacterium]|nr:hypothetical protein [Phycisphaerae bacterium]
MMGVLLYAAGVGTGIFAIWLASRAPLAAQRDVIKYLQDELRVAQDRLLSAWKEEAVIPPRDAAPTSQAFVALPHELQELVDDWESAESRMVMAAKFRVKMAGGLSPAEILREEEAGR